MQIVIVMLVIVAAAGYLAARLVRAAQAGGACGKSCACPGQVAASPGSGDAFGSGADALDAAATLPRRQTMPTRRELVQLGVPASPDSDQATGRDH